MKRWAPHLGLIAVALFGLVSVVEGVRENWGRPSRDAVVRVGFCPNLTHGPVILGLDDEELGYQRAVGPAVRVEGSLFDSGPYMVQALFAGELDLAAVGPNPAVNGYVRSRGEAVRIVAGCAGGGAGLVVRGKGVRMEFDENGRPVAVVWPEGRATVADYFSGRTIATPSIANTQDLAARDWLAQNGLLPVERGGTVTVVPVSNAEQLTLFKKGEIDAAWAPEPWLSRLVHEGGGSLLIDERDLWPDRRMAITVLVAHPRFLDRRPDLARALLRRHVGIVAWARKNPEEARRRIAGLILKRTRKALPPEVVADAFARVEFTTDALPATIERMARRAFDAGFLGRAWPDLAPAYDPSFLKQALADEGRPGD